MTNDILSRLSRPDNRLACESAFDSLDPEHQKVLRRAAGRGAANSTPELAAAVGRDWLMVPSKRGLRQVVVTAERVWRI